MEKIDRPTPAYGMMLSTERSRARSARRAGRRWRPRGARLRVSRAAIAKPPACARRKDRTNRQIRAQAGQEHHADGDARERTIRTGEPRQLRRSRGVHSSWFPIDDPRISAAECQGEPFSAQQEHARSQQDRAGVAARSRTTCQDDAAFSRCTRNRYKPGNGMLTASWPSTGRVAEIGCVRPAIGPAR